MIACLKDYFLGIGLDNNQTKYFTFQERIAIKEFFNTYTANFVSCDDLMDSEATQSYYQGCPSAAPGVSCHSQ